MTAAESLPDTAVAMRPCRDLPNALDDIDDICRRLAGRRPALFLDYDGTLAPIAARPELAVMGQAMRQTLVALAGHLPVAIVSGRDRTDVESLVAIPGLVYAGNHGFDIAGGGLRHAVGDGFQAELAKVRNEISGAVGGIAGILIEPKTASLAIHYRLVAPEDVDGIETTVAAVANAHPRLRLMRGKKILELLPDIRWDKGQALLWLLQAMRLDGPEVLPFYIGDDVTDEDAFQALACRGVTIRVLGRSTDGLAGNEMSAAEYRLASVDEVGQLLATIDTVSGGQTVADGTGR